MEWWSNGVMEKHNIPTLQVSHSLRQSYKNVLKKGQMKRAMLALKLLCFFLKEK
jgi:hypothetical protein